eukprot:CAMPEP_0196666342 /NCGR_PEP_ID=MMETSP1086-20130531/64443_1 /TAXON_ID=77921 /ORGANISM="Cyanoptyche  gloeocystis , Strain SAG4.97" /LENGTH=491 /DNA_ID=CAMNT_0042003521 /DNA_START=40 /DNA_END=1515 /DNA_ORIENTATION=-
MAASLSPEDLAKAEQFKTQGNESYKNGRYQEAIKCYSSAIQINENSAPYYSNRAAAYLMMKNYKDATRDCMKSIALDPSFVKAYIRCGKSHLAVGELKQARKQFQQALSVDPSCAEAKEEIKNIDTLEKDSDRCTELLRREQYGLALHTVTNSLLKQCPECADFKLMKARALIGLKQYDEASSICSEVMQRDGSSTDVLFLRGKALFHLSNMSAASKHLQEVLRQDPDHSESRILLKKVKALESSKNEGNEFFRCGKNQEAIDAYSQGIAVDANVPEFMATLYCNRAAAAMKLSRFKEAVDDCSKALELNPTYTKALSRRAAAYRSMGEYEAAVRDLEKLAQMDDVNSEVLQTLRQVKLELKKSKRKDFYKILGITQSADDDEIRKAYKLMALKWHPDKNQESPEAKETAEKMFKDVAEAYSILSDPAKRRRYDAGADLEEIEQGGPNFGGADPSQLFQMFFGGGGGGGGVPFGYGSHCGGHGPGVRVHFG